MAGDIPDAEQLTEEQLRAAYEQEIKRVRVEHVLLENVVTMVNLGMRRTGLMPGTEDERDLPQVQLAIESVRALLPQIEQIAPQQVTPIRDALSQLQMAFVQASEGEPPQGGGPSGAAEGASGSGGAEPQEPSTPNPGDPGPAQRSGRLWIPGQPQ
ncbi:MAG TPA: hypothetical protein VHV75_16330 [Solirubrobacteraceae bacterium]|jgi:hypothetical protein|nr:hypothetical protein [Solirubrobacteraceae bacterium]